MSGAWVHPETRPRKRLARHLLSLTRILHIPPLKNLAEALFQRQDRRSEAPSPSSAETVRPPSTTRP